MELNQNQPERPVNVLSDILSQDASKKNTQINLLAVRSSGSSAIVTAMGFPQAVQCFCQRASFI